MTVCYYHVTYAFQSESTLHSYLNVKELLAQNRLNIWSLSDSNRIRDYNHLVCKRKLNHLAKLANDWAVLWILTVPLKHIMYASQNESTFYRWLNVKELLARNRCDMWNLSDTSRIRTQNHLVRKLTLNHLAKLAK